jgi:hypothetical protein
VRAGRRRPSAPLSLWSEDVWLVAFVYGDEICNIQKGCLHASEVVWDGRWMEGIEEVRLATESYLFNVTSSRRQA